MKGPEHGNRKRKRVPDNGGIVFEKWRQAKGKILAGSYRKKREGGRAGDRRKNSGPFPAKGRCIMIFPRKTGKKTVADWVAAREHRLHANFVSLL